MEPLRRGQCVLPDAPLYPLVREQSLELPLGFATAVEHPPVGVLLHVFHLALLPELRSHLEHLRGPASLYVSTDAEAKRIAIAEAFADWRKGPVDIRVVPNRGRDVAPKLVGLADAHDRHDYVLHLHTKSSPHKSGLEGWRGYLLDALLGSPETVDGIFEAFAREPRLGMLAPQHIDELRPWIRWSDNFELAERLARRMGIDLDPAAPLDFPSGSMFWARSAALRPLLKLGLDFDDFPAEAGQIDGTLAHAIERLYFIACAHAGYAWGKVTAPGALHEQSGVVAVSNPDGLDRFLARQCHPLDAGLGHDARRVEHQPVILTPPPRPRRQLHVDWRKALGTGLSLPLGGLRLAIVPIGAADGCERLAASSRTTLEQLPDGLGGVFHQRPGVPLSDTLAECRSSGADLVLLVDAPGLLHPGSASALLRMHAAQGGRAAIVCAQVPEPAPPPVGALDLAVSRLAGHTIAIPREMPLAVLQEADASAQCDSVEMLARRCAEAGLPLRYCPLASFHAVSDPAPPSGPDAASRDTLDVVTCLLDPVDLPWLDRLLFSIMAQDVPVPIRLHVMLARFSSAEIEAVRNATKRLRTLDRRVAVELHNWDHPAPFDLRLPLLNWGWEVARGRHLTWLDIRDQLRPAACTSLLRRLQDTQAAVAIADRPIQSVWWWGDAVVPISIPTRDPEVEPLFLVDRDRIAIGDRVFLGPKVDLAMAEFVDRLAGLRALDAEYRAEPLAIRQSPTRWLEQPDGR